MHRSYYYAENRGEGAFNICLAFDTRKLRDEWIAYQRAKDYARYVKDRKETGDWMIAQFGETLVNSYPAYEDIVFALTAREALKKHGRRNCWSERVIMVHKKLSAVYETW